MGDSELNWIHNMMDSAIAQIDHTSGGILKLPDSLGEFDTAMIFSAFHEIENRYATGLPPTNLLDLPVELRLNIYDILFASHRFIRVNTHPRLPFKPLQPAITKTCRRIREEALDFWYAQTRFRFIFRNGWCPDVGCPGYVLLRPIHKSICPRLRKLELYIESWQTLRLKIPERYLVFEVDLTQATQSYSIRHYPGIYSEKFERS